MKLIGVANLDIEVGMPETEEAALNVFVKMNATV